MSIQEKTGVGTGMKSLLESVAKELRLPVTLQVSTDKPRFYTLMVSAIDGLQHSELLDADFCTVASIVESFIHSVFASDPASRIALMVYLTATLAKRRAEQSSTSTANHFPTTKGG